MSKVSAMVCAVLLATPALAVAQPKTTTTGVLTAKHANGNCTSDDCFVQGRNNFCCTCVTLTSYMPLASEVVAIRCLTTAGGPSGDVAIRVVPCTALDAWATFESPVKSTTPQNTVVTTVFHNRSHNRDRQIELQVDYK
jgi:hypothetical protein